MLEHISAVTLAVRDMAASVDFYRRLGMAVAYGGEHSSFTSLHAGEGFINLVHSSEYASTWWGRVILRVRGVDALYERCKGQGLAPRHPPRNAPWGERYFHITDPDGHELSLAELISPTP